MTGWVNSPREECCLCVYRQHIGVFCGVEEGGTGAISWLTEQSGRGGGSWSCCCMRQVGRWRSKEHHCARQARRSGSSSVANGSESSCYGGQAGTSGGTAGGWVGWLAGNLPAEQMVERMGSSPPPPSIVDSCMYSLLTLLKGLYVL